MSVTLALVKKKKITNAHKLSKLTCLVGYSVYFLFIYIFFNNLFICENTVIGIENQKVI